MNNNKLPAIIGVIALLLVAGGAAFYYSKDMKNESAPVTADAAQVDQAAPAAGTDGEEAGEQAAAPAEKSEPAVPAEEEDEAAKAAGSIEGVTVEQGNPVVARVDGQDITRVDVFRYIKMMPAAVQQLPPAQVYPLALEQVIDTRMVQNKAENAGLENDPEVKAQVSMAEQQIVRSVYVQREVDRQISESDMKKKYDGTVGKAPAVQEINASHILVATEEDAKKIIEELGKGEDFAKLAAKYSADPGNKDKGGELGWFAKQDMVPEFSDAAFKIAKGEVSKTPVKTQFGYHVVKVNDKRERPKPSFEELKPMLQVELRREKLEAMLENWRKSAKVERFDINGKPVKAEEKQEDVAPSAGAVEAPAADAPAAAE